MKVVLMDCSVVSLPNNKIVSCEIGGSFTFKNIKTGKLTIIPREHIKMVKIDDIEKIVSEDDEVDRKV